MSSDGYNEGTDPISVRRHKEMVSPNFYHTGTTGPSAEGFGRGLQQAVKLAKSNGTNQVLLTVHTLSNLEGIIRTVLGERVFSLFSDKRLLNVDGAMVHLETDRIRSSFQHGVFFAPFVSPKRLAKLQKDHRATDIVYVPWAPDELNSYRATHGESVEI